MTEAVVVTDEVGTALGRVVGIASAIVWNASSIIVVGVLEDCQSAGSGGLQTKGSQTKGGARKWGSRVVKEGREDRFSCKTCYFLLL